MNRSPNHNRRFLAVILLFGLVVLGLMARDHRAPEENRVDRAVASDAPVAEVAPPAPPPAAIQIPAPVNVSGEAPAVVRPPLLAPSRPSVPNAGIVPVPMQMAPVPSVPEPVAAAPSPLLAPAPQLAPNYKFGEDIVSIEALGWRMQSSHQYYEGHERPSSLGFGVRALHWFDRYGLEGILRTDLFGLNRAGGRSEITDLEARVHGRTFTRSPFSVSRRVQLSALAGVERFRNARSDLYSEGYDLLKIGATAVVPLWEHWGVSAEVGLGFDVHASRKYEAQYMVQYFWDKTWSLGLGYRINLFEARTASQAPGGLFPYREGYTEIRSALSYHF